VARPRKLRQEQREAARRAEQPALFELHEDCRRRAEFTGQHLERRRGATSGNGKSHAAAHRAKFTRRATRHSAKP